MTPGYGVLRTLELPSLTHHFQHPRPAWTPPPRRLRLRLPQPGDQPPIFFRPQRQPSRWPNRPASHFTARLHLSFINPFSLPTSHSPSSIPYQGLGQRRIPQPSLVLQLRFFTASRPSHSPLSQPRPPRRCHLRPSLPPLPHIYRAPYPAPSPTFTLGRRSPQRHRRRPRGRPRPQRRPGRPPTFRASLQRPCHRVPPSRPTPTLGGHRPVPPSLIRITPRRPPPRRWVGPRRALPRSQPAPSSAVRSAPPELPRPSPTDLS